MLPQGHHDRLDRAEGLVFGDRGVGHAPHAVGEQEGVLLLAEVSVAGDVAAMGDEPEHGQNAIYWTFWQGAILQGIAGASLVQSPSSDTEDMMSLWAIGTWPTSLSAHGAWFSGGSGNVALGTVALSDGVMLLYDGVVVGSGERVGPTYATIETVVSAMQVGFGITTMARADQDDRWKVAGWTLLPTSLFLHGTLSLILPQSRDSDHASAARSQRRTRKGGIEDFTWGVLPIPSGAVLEAGGRW